VQIIESMFDPDTIIFGGEVPKDLLERLIPALHPLFPSVADRAARPLPRLMTGDADRWAVALGAASEPISREFDPRLAAMLKVGGAEVTSLPVHRPAQLSPSAASSNPSVLPSRPRA